MNRKFVLLLLIIIVLLLAAGCNLPGAVVMTETAVEASPTPVTPSPTETRTPTATPSPEPTATCTPTFGPTPTPTLGPEFFHGSLWYEPKFVSQEELYYRGRKIKTGCTAASVQMVLDFWHSYKEEYPTISAQKLLDMNDRQGQFNVSSGLNIMNTEDDLNGMNYYLGVCMNSDKEDLLAALERYGPLLILTKVNWTPFGENHMAVVSGYDPESDIIRVLDPWQLGGIMEFPYENFDGIWSLNYLDDPNDVMRRTFFFIVPYQEIAPNNHPFISFYEMKKLSFIE